MKYIILFAYDLVFIIGYIFYLPILFYRKKITFFSLREKLGFIKLKTIRESIWLQVVSVGEVNLVYNLINSLIKNYSNPIIVSTTTLTGYKLAKEKYVNKAQVIFFPLDISFIVKKVIKMINPKLFIALETEIWPNVFLNLKRKNIPVIILNGRISKRAFKRYQRIKNIMRKVLSLCSFIGVQNFEYKEIFLSLGAPKEKIHITGNLKFANFKINQKSIDYVKNFILPLITRREELILVAGSTHSPEEKLLLDIIKNIPYKINLIIAPRHLNRIEEIEKIIKEEGFIPIRISQINFKNIVTTGKEVYLLDSIGELLAYYSISDISFVGGTFSQTGGHNILEPLYFSKPTIFGPSMENFLEIENLALEKNAAIKVKDTDDLKNTILKIIEDKKQQQELASRSKEVFLQAENTLKLNLEIISKYLKL